MAEKEVEAKPRLARRGPGKLPTSRAASVDNQVIDRKNKQLNQATKQLEEKVKNLQEKSKARSLPRLAKEKPPPRANSAPPRELPGVPASLKNSLEKRRGSTVTSRIREREAEFAKQVQDREEQIRHLKERLRLLSQKLSDSKEKDFKFPRDRDKVVKDQQEDGFELQSIIKQVTKERLQLERHLQIANDSLQRNNGFDLQKYITLEQSNQYLRQQLDSLDLLQQEHKLVEIQYREKEEACRELVNTLKYKSALCDDLESQLAKVIEKNTQLTIANNDLQKKVVELQDVSEECATLKFTLEKVETDYTNAKSEVNNLNGKVRNLESVLDEMHKAADNRREIERQHKEALENLKKKQEEVEIVATKKQTEMIDKLKLRISELEAEKEVQNERHQELILEMAELKKYGPESIASDIEAPSDNLEIDQIMAKLEQDNKFLADLEKQRKAAKVLNTNITETTSASSTSSTSTNGHSDTNSSSTPSSNNHSPTSLPRTNSAITDSGFLSQSSLSSPGSRLLQTSSTGSLNKLPGVSGADKINLLNGGSYKATGGLDNKLVNNNAANAKNGIGGSAGNFMDKDGSIEVPGKGWCFVYIARYSYDPFQHSPNDNPEAELQVNAGDYILVWGEVDEDGFYDGELLDGRRGLVPSNFVEKLEGEELFDFHQQVVLGLGDCDDSVCTSIPQDLDFMSADECSMETDSTTHHNNTKLPTSAIRKTISGGLTTGSSSAAELNLKRTCITPDDAELSKAARASLPQYASCTDLDMTEDDEADQEMELKGGQVPCPRHLTFEPQQNRSVVIAWSPPEIKAHLICSYQVIVDSSLYTAVKGSLKTTIGNLDLSYIHRISVKSVTKDNKVSNEAGCTMVIGKEAPMRPTSVKATRVTSTSATISWIPSNTNFMHAIIVNNCEVKTVKQGVFKHSLAGLSPNTTYKVKVRAKNLKAATYLSNNYQLSSGILEVTTKPKGLPDPPLDLQVLKGPKEGTISVTWLPVTINPSGTSNGAPVLGYHIYADGELTHEVHSGTADQAIVEILPSASTISMRTLTSNDDMSIESESCKIPISVKAQSMMATYGTSNKNNIHKNNNSAVVAAAASGVLGGFTLSKCEFSINKSMEDIEDDDDHNVEVIDGMTTTSNNTMPIPQREVLINYSSGYPELDSDIGPSELSDIAEEPEEGLTSEDGSRGSTPKILNNSSTALGAANQQQHTSASTITRWSSSGLYSNSSQNSLNNSKNSTSMTSFVNNEQQQKVEQPSKAGGEGFLVSKVEANDDKVLEADDGILNRPIIPQRENNLVTSKQQQQPTNNNINHNNTTVTSTTTISSNATTKVQINGGTSVNQNNTNSNNSDNTNINNTTKPKLKIRIFVALFDYDPPTMSPNPDACDEELPFREGQLIKVYGDKDADGFYWGEAAGNKGYVPCNMVSEVQVDDDRVAEELFKEQTSIAGTNNKVKVTATTTTTSSSTIAAPPFDDRWGDIYEDMPAKRKLALYDYDPVELSPNVDAEVELSFRAGDIVLVYGEMDDDGFFMGELNGRRGLVPSNFLTDVPPGYIFVDQSPHVIRSSTSNQPRILGTQRRW